MSHSSLETAIDAAWERREHVNPQTKGEIAEAVNETLRLLDEGALRVASQHGDEWKVHQWVKKAVLL